jgi:DNA-binding MarR family transcriptional regulator
MFFYELTNAIHNLMLQYEFMRKRNLKLGRVESNLLYYLATINKQVNLKEVAKKLDVSFSRITHLMDNLEKKGYALRIPCLVDKRIIRAQITPTGIEIAKVYKEKNIKMFINFLRKYPAEEIEPTLQALNYWHDLLKKVNERLRKSENIGEE